MLHSWDMEKTHTPFTTHNTRMSYTNTQARWSKDALKFSQTPVQFLHLSWALDIAQDEINIQFPGVFWIKLSEPLGISHCCLWMRGYTYLQGFFTQIKLEKKMLARCTYIQKGGEKCLTRAWYLQHFPAMTTDASDFAKGGEFRVQHEFFLLWVLVFSLIKENLLTNMECFW